MKKLIFAFMFFANGFAFAQTTFERNTLFHETALSSATMATYSVDTNGVTNVSTGTVQGKLTGRFLLEICNDDQFADIFCGFSNQVSSSSTSGYTGRRIRKRNADTTVERCNNFQIGEEIDLFCVSESTTTPPRVSVMQLR